jgi:hypothetical protein
VIFNCEIRRFKVAGCKKRAEDRQIDAHEAFQASLSALLLSLMTLTSMTNRVPVGIRISSLIFIEWLMYLF